MTELLPCPFCGCKDIDEYEGEYGNGVYCMNCGAMMGEQIHREFHVHERVAYEQAAEAWNTRAERTCRCTTDDNARCFVCSECGKSFPRSDLKMAHNHGEINYCPNCGAKVVD